MAENPTPQQTIDFTDLAQETRFKYKGKEYVIGAITFKTAKELFEQAKKLGKDDDKDMTATVDYLAKAVVKSDGSPVTVDDIDEWPMAMIQKVTEMVTKMISGPLVTSEAPSPTPPAE